MVAGGYRAIEALRLEKGYRVWSSDITPDDTPDQAGLGFAVRMGKSAPFIGRDALEAARAGGADRRLCLPGPRRAAGRWRWATSRSGSASRSWAA